LNDEYVIHHFLEGSGRVAEAEKHDKGFEKAVFGFEGGFPFVALLKTDVIETPSYIEFRIESVSSGTVEAGIDEREWICVLDRFLIDESIILTWAFFAI
jgi:hypothetical protein